MRPLGQQTNEVVLDNDDAGVVFAGKTVGTVTDQTHLSFASAHGLAPGQAVRFVVDAFPERDFEGKVRQFRLSPNVTQNVVTYNVVIEVDNPDELLKPGLTAQVRIITANKPDALRVPTAPSESGREVAQDTAHDALLTTCEALVAILERQLQTSGPTALARLCQGVGDRLGFAPRAVRELMLVARLRGVLRAELLARGPLPPVVPTLLGYQTDSPLIGAAHELQKVLVDFMRLPQDEDEPLGARIITTAALALDLYHRGLTDEALLKELRKEVTIVLVEHDMEAVFALADRITVLVYGRVIACGKPDEIRNNEEVRRAYLGDQHAVTRHG